MTALLADPIYREHLLDRDGHPERPERYDAVMEGLAPWAAHLGLIPSRDACHEELLLCHTARLPGPGKKRRGIRAFPPEHRRYRRHAELLAGGDSRGGWGAERGGCGLFRPRGERILRGAAARAPCHGQPRHGLLRAEQRSACGAPCPATAWRRARADRGLGRPPRQRHAGYFLRRPQRLLFQHAPVAALSGNRPRRRDRRRAGCGHHHELSFSGRFGPGRDSRRGPQFAGAGDGSVPAGVGFDLRRIRFADRRPCWEDLP